MSGHRGTESEFELTLIDRLEQLHYCPLFGPELDRLPDEVVLKDVLHDSLRRRYPDLPATALAEAVTTISRPVGVDTLRRNMAFHQMLTRGFELKVEFPDGGPDGHTEYRHIYPVDWEHPHENDFYVVNQLPIRGQNDRRPDLIIFVNGLPLVVFEIKNPYDDQPTVQGAINQIQHYANEIPQLFDYNALVVASDGVTTLHGMYTASEEWYSPWESIDGIHVEPLTTRSIKTLVEGLFPKDRLLEYIRDFIVFEVANDKITKKGAKYHQFFAVRLAARKAVETYDRNKAAARGKAERRIGVIWHTTGSGKSLSMVFLVGILRRHPKLENPTFVIEVDRNDLDNQLHDQFVAARSLVGDVKQAQTTDDLRSLLQTEGGEVILATIEKFRLKKETGEVKHPVLSERSNIIIIADEAHRSQYGFKLGYARYLADALPNAMRLGFTGTPISFSYADTVQVFGEVIHTYDIEQSQKDHATVPIFYEPRQIKVRLQDSGTSVDQALQEITEGEPLDTVEKRKTKWAALAALARADDRVKELASDLLKHFLDRIATLKGKAMVVCMERENCVKVYEELTALPNCPEVRLVMTANLEKDPTEWSAKGYYTTKAQRDTLKKRMVDPDDPLLMVIVCDMWLTGTDIPCLHTLYLDKPMEGHNIIQAISRVNRVFSDKPHGLVVDYIGIGDQLREATAKYAQGGGKGAPAPSLEETARPLFMAELEAIRQMLPSGHDFGAWPRMTRIEVEDLYGLVYGHLASDAELRDSFLQAELRLSSAFLLVKHLDDCRVFADEIVFFQRVRKQINKTVPGQRPKRDIEQAVRDLVDDSIQSEGVVDIFKAAGLEKADISILDDKFLQTFRNQQQENLQVVLLTRLVEDENTTAPKTESRSGQII